MNKDFINAIISEAQIAYNEGEVPVGAIVVKNNKIISKAHNIKESTNNVSNHAEILAIIEAESLVNDWRLDDCVLYTTLFPCPMCASAIQQSRISKIYYLSNSNNKYGEEISNLILSDNRSNHIVKMEKINYKFDLLDLFFNNIRNK